jgi:hypothetical protein
MYLRYYTGDRFPLDQNTGGPYSAYPGNPGLATRGPFPVAQVRKPCCRRRCTTQRTLMGLGDTTAGLPSGSQLVYSATWDAGKILQDYSSVVSDLGPRLTAQGIVIDGSTGIPWYQSGYGVTLKIHTTIDFNSAADVKSIVDHWIQQLESGGMPRSSITTSSLAAPITTLPSGATSTGLQQMSQNYADAVAAGDSASAAYWQSQIQAATGAPAQGSDFLSKNWPWLVAGGAAALVAAKVL